MTCKCGCGKQVKGKKFLNLEHKQKYDHAHQKDY